MSSSTLKKAFEYYLKNQDSLVKKYLGKYLAIADDSVLGAYDSEVQAIEETSKTRAIGTFLVQRAEPGEESYSQTFHSRVVFA